MKKKYSLLLLALMVGPICQAQPALSNWRFGNQAGLVFPGTGPPTVVASSALTSYEACSSISDGAGNLLCYTNAEQVWDRTNTPMPNGLLSFSSGSATQGALLVPKPGSAQEYYLFTVDAIENGLAGGLRYSVIDMSLRGGLGDVSAAKDVAVPLPGGLVRVTEKLTAVQLANGRDYWVIVHGWTTDRFYSFLLSPAGLQSVPVVSSVGSVHTSSGGFSNNAVGYLRASPNGSRLAVAQRDRGLELFDFDRATGAVSNARNASISAQYYYGLEFSADGSKLYTTDLVGSSVFQIDLANPGAAVRIGTASSFTGGLLRGRDNRIYVGVDRSNYLAVIPNPNAAGTACGFQNNGAFLGGGVQGRIGLPNFPNDVGPAVLPPGGTSGGGSGSPGGSSNQNNFLTAAALPNIITPNGDVVNEYFALPAAQAAQWSLAVYNRWGRQVFQQAPYDNRWNAAGLADGVYFYFLSNGGSGQNIKGWVEVRR